jgi:iron complex transport system substrate-binding protein
MKRTLTQYGSIFFMLAFWLCMFAEIAPASDYPVAIMDQSGRTIQMSRPFKRIISLYGAHTENLFSLGLDAEIIGVTQNEVYPPQALKRPQFSYHDDLEKFLAAKPDLVLIRPMIDRGYARLTDGLARHGVTVVSLQPTTLAEIYAYWQTLGGLTGTQTRAADMIRQFQAAIDQIEARTKLIEPKKQVYFEAIHSRMKTFSPDSIPMVVLKIAGGLNVAQDAEPVRETNIASYGKEKIMSKADQIDVFLAQSGIMNQPSTELIREEPGFHVIKAVQNNQIFLVDEMLVSRPTLRLLDGIGTIERILYPDRLASVGQRIRTEVRD